jgi:ABC-type oligopeptide transport system ATPase subunit
MMDLKDEFGLTYIIIAHDRAVVQHLNCATSEADIGWRATHRQRYEDNSVHIKAHHPADPGSSRGNVSSQ